ncbi:hypothetical protein N0X72_13570 [Streptomyces carpaticus]|uniref:Uncharacterized protein n=2 Tax=Streptomyces TaxID=1883 RepID=A0A1I6TCJ5_9ACTN|nr:MULTISPECIES: hypothetical protein [Streptomyces]MCK1816141.1 hypothetical protein [Streptomyces sp. XM4011]QKV69558.1 hypothetical protein HUT13_12775 [Streptomyces harbinensis]UWM49959.1 hypothetical protein N0X72_13570 [Streptomyces carpaticus]SFS86906.1 hypothetical protein SAMN05444716_104548 [Streptomyces harbinensis]
MGWTHDYRDVARNRSGKGAAAQAAGGAVRRIPGGGVLDPPIGFPHILRRRARWVGARLRHPRGRIDR